MMRNYNKSERKIFTLLEYIPAFLLPCCILVLIMKICGVVPFGDKPVFIWDALYQYKDYFGYLWDVLHGNADIQYAASKSLGGGFMGILGYYCSSPLNYLLMFFNKNSIPAFMSLMVLLRISLSGLTCNIYLNKRFHTPLIFGLILSTSYALMEYNVYYCRNCMWLDGVIMLPLIALGIWNIMGDKGITLLWITVALSIIGNWYAGYMVCLMSGFFFIFEYCLKADLKLLKELNNGGIKIIRNYLLGMLGGVTSGSVILFPALMALLSGKASNNRNFFSTVINFDFFHFFSGFDISSQVYSTVEPIVYCSYFTLVCCLYIFLAHNIEKKKKYVIGVLFLFLTSSFCFKQLELLWTAFIESKSFYFRFAFVFAFFMIWTSAFAVDEILHKGVDQNAMFWVVGIVLAIGYLLNRSGELFSKPKIILCSLICVLLYAFVLYFVGSSWGSSNKIFSSLLFLATLGVVCGELAYNEKLAFAHYDSSEKCFSEYERQMEELISYMDSQSKCNYYRFEKNKSYLSLGDSTTTNPYVATCESMFYNYHSLEHYSSSYDPDVNRFLICMGYSNWTNDNTFLTETYWNGPMVFMEALLSEKYILWDKDTFGYKKLKNAPVPILEGQHLYQNEFYLPLGYNISSDVKEIEYCENPFENQNQLYASFLGRTNKLYCKPDVIAQGISDDHMEEYWTLEVKKDGPVYIFPDGRKAHNNFYVDNAIICVDGKEVQNISKRFLINAVLIGDYHTGDRVQISIKKSNKNNQHYTLYAGQLDTEVFEKCIGYLRKGYRSDLNFNGNKVEGRYYTEKDTIVCLTIPFEKNWKVYVDGKKVEARKLAGIFTGIDLAAGNHEIRMVYRAPGLLTGLMVSAVSWLCLVAYVIIIRGKNESHSGRRLEKYSEL